MIVFGALGILDTLLMSSVMTLHMGVIMPAIIGLPPLVIGLFYGPLCGWMREKKIGRLLKIAVISAYALFFTGFFVFLGFNISKAHTPPPNNADVLIVLGCRIHGETPSLTLSYRLKEARDFLFANPKAAVVVSGGQGTDEDIPEAHAMKTRLLSYGISEDRIFVEDRSTSTEENFLFSGEIIKRELDTENVVFVTSSFHVLRAERIAKKCGLNASGIPAPSAWYTLPNEYLREFAATVQYFFTGRL